MQRVARRRRRAASSAEYQRRRSRRAWSSSTSSTASRPPRPATWRAAGTARPGKCGSCSAEINGKPRLMCMTRMDIFAAGRADHRRAAQDLPADQGPGHRRLATTTRRPSRSRRSSPSRRSRRHATGCSRRTSTASRSSTSASSASCARTSATSSATTRRTRPRSPGRASSSAGRARDAPARHATTARELITDAGGPRLLQHHQVLHRGLPRAHPHHRQRDHPAEGARGRPTYYDPVRVGAAEAGRQVARRPSRAT